VFRASIFEPNEFFHLSIQVDVTDYEMMIKRSMGLVGLGVMGRNLALNMAEKGVAVVAYDPWDDVRTSFSSTLDADESNLITVSQSIKELVASLPGPRTLLIMVKAGEPVDA
jgi:6-phosphogluconate dehydrogenase